MHHQRVKHLDMFFPTICWWEVVKLSSPYLLGFDAPPGVKTCTFMVLVLPGLPGVDFSNDLNSVLLPCPFGKVLPLQNLPWGSASFSSSASKWTSPNMRCNVASLLTTPVFGQHPKNHCRCCSHEDISKFLQPKKRSVPAMVQRLMQQSRKALGTPASAKSTCI